MRLPARPSRIALMIGTPPATADSNATVTPFSCAAANTSLPWSAMSALFAVTTCLPLAMARRTRSRASPVPPMTSTTIEISELHTTSRGSSQSVKASVAQIRSFPGSRTAARTTSMARPARREISSRLRASTLTVPPPTVPRPSNPILTGFMGGGARWRPPQRRPAPSRRPRGRGGARTDSRRGRPVDRTATRSAPAARVGIGSHPEAQQDALPGGVDSPAS